ncbi:ATP-binding protein [Haliea sp. E1-2-M8]|uniref:ATP-binding response regulator n=1 Tax=Haliea sp. E1-2-M8 TaxID=3064706 RepID=UPI002725E418|nr:ATP-binding protein [Haliea sp. E1-2-M8]MDO8862649.1 ATP-binding protein [Haliea sp. E1-2-M8]
MDAAAATRLQQLEDEVASLRNTNRILMDRVEHRINVEGGAFAAFQVASNLEKTVADRTTELRRLNERMEHELDLRRSFENALLRAKEQAEEATASRTRFVAAASHDLRQPLNAAMLYLETIRGDGLPPADRDSLQGVALALETLNRLLGALLDISRLDSGGLHPEPRHFSLQPLFERLATEYRSVAEAKHLGLTVIATSCNVHSDPMLLETVLRNLISNAIKYTRHGRVLMGVRRRGDRIAIEVRDTGVGISSEHQHRIFDEFWRAPGASMGQEGSMGLGLAIVERICRLLGTTIVVRSLPGKGSSFSLELAVGEANTVASVEASATPLGPVGFNQCPVVVIDDNIHVLRSMVRLLENWDCKVIAAPGYEEVLTKIIDQDLMPRLLLTDFHLASGTNGLEAVRSINAELPRPAPAIMISSDSSIPLRDELRSLGIPLLTKPIDPARLRATMRHMLAPTPDLSA